MKTAISIILVLITCIIHVNGDTSINSANDSAYGANIGWLNCRGDVTNGVVIGEYVCSGYIYSANTGWIHLGDGSPTNGIQYSNMSSNDYGINHDASGNLSGYAYGANIGWVNFVTNGGPKVDLLSGVITGYVYSANAGWISLSNAFSHVQTDSIQAGTDSDSDGITDAWELQYTNSLTVLTASGDYDADGAGDVTEYLSDTDPLDPSIALTISSISMDTNGTQGNITWQSRNTRYYRIEASLALTNPAGWADSGLGLQSPDAGTNTTRTVPYGSASPQFFRVRAVRPLFQ